MRRRRRRKRKGRGILAGNSVAEIRAVGVGMKAGSFVALGIVAGMKTGCLAAV